MSSPGNASPTNGNASDQDAAAAPGGANLPIDLTALGIPPDRIQAFVSAVNAAYPQEAAADAFAWHPSIAGLLPSESWVVDPPLQVSERRNLFSSLSMPKLPQVARPAAPDAQVRRFYARTTYTAKVILEDLVPRFQRFALEAIRAQAFAHTLLANLFIEGGPEPSQEQQQLIMQRILDASLISLQLAVDNQRHLAQHQREQVLRAMGHSSLASGPTDSSTLRPGDIPAMHDSLQTAQAVSNATRSTFLPGPAAKSRRGRRGKGRRKGNNSGNAAPARRNNSSRRSPRPRSREREHSDDDRPPARGRSQSKGRGGSSTRGRSSSKRR